jgi:hypothetical protein
MRGPVSLKLHLKQGRAFQPGPTMKHIASHMTARTFAAMQYDILEWKLVRGVH